MFSGKRMLVVLMSCCAMVLSCVLMVGCGKESTEMVWIPDEEHVETSPELFAKMGRTLASMDNFKEKVLGYWSASDELEWSMDVNILDEQEYYHKFFDSYKDPDNRFTEWYVEPSTEHVGMRQVWIRDQPDNMDPQYQGQWRHYTEPNNVFGRMFLLDFVNAGLDIDVPIEETDDGYQVTINGYYANKFADVVLNYVEGKTTGYYDEDVSVVIDVDWDFYLTRIDIKGTMFMSSDGGAMDPFHYNITLSDYGVIAEDEVNCPDTVKDLAIDLDEMTIE